MLRPWIGSSAYPKIQPDSDSIFVRDGSVYTSAGVTAGIDMALALIEEDLGRAVALEVARRLVVFLKRPGGQSQFSSRLAAQGVSSAVLRDLPSGSPSTWARTSRSSASRSRPR